MLRYAIKRHEGHSVETPTQLYDDNIPVPDPPRPGSIKVVVGGFPWQVLDLNDFDLHLYKRPWPTASRTAP